MEPYRIVKGNSVKLHAVVRKLEMTRDMNRLTDFDMRLCDKISVELIEGWGDSRKLDYKIVGTDGNEIVCVIPGDLDYGRYGVRISWERSGMPMASVERKLLGIVDHNSQTRLPLGQIETESAGLFTVSYWLESSGTGEYADDSTHSVICIQHYAKVNNTSVTVKDGGSYETEVSADDGCQLGEVYVIMGGEDITSAVYDTGTHKINILDCSGDIIIVACGKILPLDADAINQAFDESNFYDGAKAQVLKKSVTLNDLLGEIGF